MMDFIQCLQECWISYGWGKIELNMDAYKKGYLIAILQNPASSTVAEETDKSICHVESGFLSGFFGQLTQQDLDTLEVPSGEDDKFYFVLGLPERLSPLSALIEEGHTFDTIMERICDG